MKVIIIGGCFPHAIHKIGTVIKYDYDPKRTYYARDVYWVEFEDIVFEGADPETQHPNRAYFFGPEVMVL